jgi:hypothetical protein
MLTHVEWPFIDMIDSFEGFSSTVGSGMLTLQIPAKIKFKGTKRRSWIDRSETDEEGSGGGRSGALADSHY